MRTFLEQRIDDMLLADLIWVLKQYNKQIKHLGLNFNGKQTQMLWLFVVKNYKNKDVNAKNCRVASYTEWKVLYDLCRDKHGLLHKDTIRAVYDGSLFERLEKERQSTSKKA